ncbi:O-methyltransferase [Sphingopyxis sp. GC21]|uniref:O-methyltransferase n=1 Tax=Sphingopyxis sp. GC21 TaxID=2933562 RepID=UPI0021E48CAE|nr:class I SAM-dependent methyltransferase [Sphingopyxis sp. GC21]
MNSAFETVMARYEARAREEEAALAALSTGEAPAVLDDLLLSIGPVVGSFLAELVRGARPRHIVELGTSYGYSTLWLARAAAEVDARIVSVDVAAQKQDYAREQLREAGLESVVEFRTGDAVELVSRLDFAVDLALLDIWKELYIPCFETLRPKLSQDSIVVADNMLEPVAHRESAEKYQKHVRALKGVSSIALPLGQGLEVTRFLA